MTAVLLIGTGEYTTGYVHGKASQSDKGAGVVGLTFFDLRKRGLVGQRIALCGTTGTKFPGMRQHLKACIQDRYKGVSTACESFPADEVARDPAAYKAAIASFGPGDIAVVTTPDDTHKAIALACIERGMHVMVTKPLVKTLADHVEILRAAKKHGVLVCLEFHKRYDPIYSDAVNRIRSMEESGMITGVLDDRGTQRGLFLHR